MPKFLRWAENSRLFKIVLSSWTMRVKSKSELVIFWTLRKHWKREQNRNSKQEIPWLHGQDVPRTYYFFTVGLVKTNSIQLSLNLICFTLLSSKKQTNKLTKTKPQSSVLLTLTINGDGGMTPRKSGRKKKSKCNIIKIVRYLRANIHWVLSTSVSN